MAYDKVILVVSILVHETRPGLEMKRRPEVLWKIFRMRMELHILPLMIKPANNFFHFTKPLISAAHVHKKDMLGAKFITDAA